MSEEYPNKVIVSDKYEKMYVNVYKSMEEACLRYTEIVANTKKHIAQGEPGYKALPITVELITVHSSIKLS